MITTKYYLVEIQFYNTNRGLGWVEIGSKDTLDEYGSLQTFTRPIEDLYAVMDTNFTNSITYNNYYSNSINYITDLKFT